MIQQNLMLVSIDYTLPRDYLNNTRPKEKPQ